MSDAAFCLGILWSVSFIVILSGALRWVGCSSQRPAGRKSSSSPGDPVIVVCQPLC